MPAQSNQITAAAAPEPKGKQDAPILHKDLMKLMAKAGYAKMTRWSRPAAAASK